MAPNAPAKKAAAKKAPAKKAAANAPAILGPSPCDLRGKENPVKVFARAGQRIDVFFLLCAASARLRIDLSSLDQISSGGTTILPTTTIPPAPNPIVVPLGNLGKGQYVVTWMYEAFGDYQIVAETQVDGVPIFRKVNALKDGLPTGQVWSVVEIL
jgi:hypothetical protein